MKRFTAWVAGFVVCTVIGVCVCLTVLGIGIMLWPVQLMAAGTMILGLTCVLSTVTLSVQMIRAIREARKYPIE